MPQEDLLEKENEALKQRIQELETELATFRSTAGETKSSAPPPVDIDSCHQPRNEIDDAAAKVPLSIPEYKRYGRQMIIPEIGLEGQLRLKSSKVLIVGAGGLGCPAAAYLAGAGVGTLGIIDHDTVEHSNLHRQIIHASSRVGVSKVESAITYLQDLNPDVKYIPHPHSFDPTNALSIVQNYDLVLDCTDHPSIRYLISDTAILLRKPIVSASALRTEGQLINLNNPPGIGPCYRCIWPKPPPAESVVGCGEGGILGPVVGCMGVLQALEAIKILSSPPFPPSLPPETTGRTTMTIFSAYSTPQFRSLKMRGRREGCLACGDPKDVGARITAEKIRTRGIDYMAFCGGAGAAVLGVLGPKERVGVEEYARVRKSGERHLLVDVRDKTQFGICRIEGSINVPYSEFQTLQYSTHKPSIDDPGSFNPDEKKKLIPRALGALLSGNTREEQEEPGNGDFPDPVYILCRFGNDSQLAVRQLREAGLKGEMFDIKGGIAAWARSEVDGVFPEY